MADALDIPLEDVINETRPGLKAYDFQHYLENNMLNLDNSMKHAILFMGGNDCDQVQDIQPGRIIRDIANTLRGRGVRPLGCSNCAI